MSLCGRVRSWGLATLAIGLALLGSPRAEATDPPRSSRDDSSERRAIAYLAREVPRWSRENRCFSCHNNGDAARALLDASRRGYPIDPGALQETARFLADPKRWDQNGVNAAFSDKRLARLQFAAALAGAVASGTVMDRAAPLLAAQAVADDQSRDGSWPIEEDALIGSPATYGQPLATALARQTLAAADPARFAATIANADGWLRRQPVRNVLEASAVLLALDDKADSPLRRQCWELLRRAQSHEGGWGPFVNAAPEVFDTAIALLALGRKADDPADVVRLGRGRAYLIASQAEDGSWPETTRPSGGESYAQRISTTGWATLALLATGRRPYGTGQVP